MKVQNNDIIDYLLQSGSSKAKDKKNSFDEILSLTLDKITSEAKVSDKLERFKKRLTEIGAAGFINELNSNKDEIVKKVKSIGEYGILFNDAYDDGINYENIVDALVEFEKAVLSIDSPFDEYLAGNDDSINNEAKKGFELFNKIGCVACHNGRNLGGNLMQNVGLKDASESRRLMRVPSLRNVARTAPYLSSGEMSDLKEVIGFVSYHQLIHTLSSEELEQIYKFLLTLNGRRPRILNE